MHGGITSSAYTFISELKAYDDFMGLVVTHVVVELDTQ